MNRPLPRNHDEDRVFLLDHLRLMLKDSRAVFRSQIQSDVTATVLAGSMDTLVVLPTAAGKTVCFLLPCFIEKSTKCTIVVVPLVALK